MKTICALLAIFTLGLGSGMAEIPLPVPPCQQLSIPERENGYGNFETRVIRSQAELDGFIKQVVGEDGWNHREEFVKALQDSKLDFAVVTLVLLRHSEGSGSTRVDLKGFTWDDKRLSVEIVRQSPEIGTADMAYYCYALAIDKARVRELAVTVGEAAPTIIPLAPN